MAIMVGVVGCAVGVLSRQPGHPRSGIQRDISAIRLIAKMPTIAARAYKYHIGQPFMYAAQRPELRRQLPVHDASRFRAEEYKVESGPGQGAWTASSSCTPTTNRTPRPRPCVWPVRRGLIRSPVIAAGIACLWGPAHGGANEACLQMLEEIGDVSRVPEFIARAKDKNDSFKLMGFGHRVYKNFDPRAKLMRQTCHEVLNELGLQNDRLFKLAMELERIALEDEYFIEKKLYPNVDFYSGIVQKALGIPTSMFTCIFALARTVGWITQWNEMITDPEYKIGRPRQLYVGPARRDIKA
jgi:citrate synthase